MSTEKSITPQQLKIIFKYYNACWAAFNCDDLASLFDNDIKHIYEISDPECSGCPVEDLTNITKGKEKVIQLYKEHLFDNIFIEKTRIESIAIHNHNGPFITYELQYEKERLVVLESINIGENGLIKMIDLTVCKNRA